MYFSQITLVADSVPGKGSFFLVAQSVKNPPAMQETTCKKEMATPFQYFCLGNPRDVSRFASGMRIPRGQGEGELFL